MHYITNNEVNYKEKYANQVIICIQSYDLSELGGSILSLCEWTKYLMGIYPLWDTAYKESDLYRKYTCVHCRWNYCSNTSLWEVRTHWLCIFNIMVVDDLATPVSRASSTMVLFLNVSIMALESVDIGLSMLSAKVSFTPWLANSHISPEVANDMSYMVSHVCVLTHWGRVTHICVDNLTTIGSDTGLSPDRRQAII